MENFGKSDNGAEIFAEGGETGERLRAFDWANTPLGAPETWSESLKIAVRSALDSREPTFAALDQKRKRAETPVESNFAGADIKTHSRIEADRKFLFEIAEKIRRSENAEDLLFAIAAAVGEHLQVRRCLFNEIDIENDRETVHRDYCRGVESVAGVHRISAYSSTTSAEIQAGKTVVNRDSKTDSRTAALYEQTYAPVGERAYVAVPLLRENQWVASLWVSDDEPRDWSGAEINLLETVAERAWLAVEKLRSEKALRESEERFSKAFNTTPHLMTITDFEGGRYLSVNDSVVQATGYTRDEMIGRTADELNIFAESEVRAKLPDAFQNDVVRDLEMKLRMKTGGIRLLKLSADVINVQGEKCILTTSIDITESKRSERLLIEQQRLAVLNSDVSLALIQNQSLPEILNSCAEILVKHLDAAFARIWTLNEKENVLELQASAGIYTHLDGAHSRIPVGKYKIGLIAANRKPHLTNSVIGDSSVNNQEWAKREGMIAFAGYPLIVGERLIGVAAVFARHPFGGATLESITSAANTIALGIERNRVEEKIRESEERFAKAFNSSPLAVTITSVKTGKLVEVNETFVNLTGYSREEAIGQTTFELGLWERSGDRETELAAVMYEKQIRNREFVFQMRDGRKIVGLLSAELLELGGELCALTVIQDITERKQTEEYLKHQKTLLEALTESVLDGIMIVSPEGKMLHFNRQFLDIWNFPAEIVESHSDERALEWAAHQTTNQAAFLERVGNVYGQPDDKVREEVAMKDGRVYERFGAPILSGETRLGWVWTFRDITERKRAEKNFAFLAEISQDLTRLTDVDEITRMMAAKIGNFFDVSNCAFAEIDTAANTALSNYVWRRDESAVDLAGKYDLSKFVTEEFRQTLLANKPVVINDIAADSRTAATAANYKPLKIGSFINTPFVSGGDLKFLLSLYKHESYEWRSDEIELVSELMTRIWSSIERTRAAERLRESEEQLRALADSIPQLTWMAEPDGFIFWYNRRWYEYTGTTPEEMEGWGWQSVHDAEMLPTVLERWQVSIQTGEPFEMEFPLRRGADGAFRWFLTRVVPLCDSSGRIVRWFGTNTDIEELRQARLQAEAANLLKDEFLATVSHELRTPLNAILGWSEMLKSGKATGEIAERANETIYRNAKSQAQLIEDLLDVSRIITGKMKLEPHPVQIASVVESAIETLRPAANAKSIEIEIDLGCKPCMIGGDEQRLQQIVWNLISNAVKFTPEGGKVEVKLENDDSHARLTVKDTGKGIEAEFLPFLFERFRQEDASSTRRHGGLGLGLAIVLNLVELHGGTISATSAGENLGATFTMKLPLISTDDKTQKNSDVKSLRESLSDGFSGANRTAKQMAGIRVLLVDDEKDTLEMLDTALTAEGADVRIAVSAADAFNILLNWQPDVLISDIAMPDEDGYSLIKKVRELKPENGGLIPAIAMTAYVRVEDRMRVLASGFQMYVPKPAEPAELINAVINLLGENKMT